MNAEIWAVVAAMAAFGCFWAGWAAGSHHTGVLDAELVFAMFHPDEMKLQPKETHKAGRKKPQKPMEEDELKRMEEMQRVQDILDNIDAYGTNVPQKEIRRRDGV